MTLHSTFLQMYCRNEPSDCPTGCSVVDFRVSEWHCYHCHCPGKAINRPSECCHVFLSVCISLFVRPTISELSIFLFAFIFLFIYNRFLFVLSFFVQFKIFSPQSGKNTPIKDRTWVVVLLHVLADNQYVALQSPCDQQTYLCPDTCRVRHLVDHKNQSLSCQFCDCQSMGQDSFSFFFILKNADILLHISGEGTAHLTLEYVAS